MTKIEVAHDDLKITIEGESNHFFSQDLYTRAVVSLIEEADTHGWEKHNFGQGKDGDAVGEFCATVLMAAARHYMAEGLMEDYENKPAYEVLPVIVSYLRESGYLHEVVNTGDASET